MDDNVDPAESAALALRLHGHEVQVVYDGTAALETAQWFHPEAVLLDIAMPRADGYEIAKELRRLPGLERVKIIGLSGFGQEAARERALQAGFDHYLTKPAGLRAIEDVLGLGG